MFEPHVSYEYVISLARVAFEKYELGTGGPTPVQFVALTQQKVWEHQYGAHLPSTSPEQYCGPQYG